MMEYVLLAQKGKLGAQLTPRSKRRNLWADTTGSCNHDSLSVEYEETLDMSTNELVQPSPPLKPPLALPHIPPTRDAFPEDQQQPSPFLSRRKKSLTTVGTAGSFTPPLPDIFARDYSDGKHVGDEKCGRHKNVESSGGTPGTPGTPGRKRQGKHPRVDSKTPVIQSDYIVCERFFAAKQFTTSLQILDGYMNHEMDCCYCSNCFRKDGTFNSLPLGWSKFGLSIFSGIDDIDVFTSWRVAYYLAPSSYILRILEERDIVIDKALIADGTDDWAIDREKTSSNYTYGEKRDPRSPSYTSAMMSHRIEGVEDRLARTEYFTDETSGKRWQVKIGFQVRLRPDCTVVHNDTSSDTRRTRRHNRTAAPPPGWMIDKPGNVVLEAMVVRMEKAMDRGSEGLFLPDIPIPNYI